MPNHYLINFNKYQIVNYTTEFLEEKIIKLIKLADKVYVYRSLNHLNQENDLIKWVKNNNESSLIKTIFVKMPKLKFYQIKSKDKEGIILLKLNEKNRNDFIDKFYISINNIKNNADFINNKSNRFIDDPLYDQYDFVFVSKNEGILITDIHSGSYVVSEIALSK